MIALVVVGAVAFAGGWMVMPRNVAKAVLGIFLVLLGFNLIVAGFAIPYFGL